MLVEKERQEEMDYVVETLQMFESGPWQEATTGAGQAPTTTKWVDFVKNG